MIFSSFVYQRPKSYNVAVVPSSVSSLRCAIPYGGLSCSETIVFLLALAVMPHHQRIVFVEITTFSFLLISFLSNQ